MNASGLFANIWEETTANHILLMHKNIPTVEYKIDIDTGAIISNITVLEPEHLPLPVQCCVKNNRLAAYAVNAMGEWIGYRSIPRSRSASLMARYDVSAPKAAAYKSFGLNLSDQYWFKPKNSDLDWESINLFRHDFWQPETESSPACDDSPCSPDVNCNGELPKFWGIEQGRRVLYKQGSTPFYQQPYNEVFASRLLAKLGLDHVPYDLKSIKDTPHSVCETFVTPNTEYIPAVDVLTARKKSNNDSYYTHFFRCLDLLNVGITKQDVDNMIVFDYIINNTDRHYGNFGYIRNAETLEFIKFAPIFDNGNSLWYDALDFDIKVVNQPAKPFRDKQDKQIKLVDEINLPIAELSDDFIREAAFEVFAPAIISGTRFMEERLNKIIHFVKVRISGILSLAEG